MDIRDKSDEGIVRHILDGDIEQFSLIVERYQKHIYGIGMRYFKDSDDSIDFSQEVFIKAYEKLGTYRGDAPFKFWLTRVGYNHAKNLIKQKRFDESLKESIAKDKAGTLEKKHIADELRGLVRRAIDSLPEKNRVCLDLFFYLGLTYQQIREITGMPVNTIKSHVLRAKNILRNSLRGTIAEEYHDL
jgi:RNA polymerase sigma-70 factor (ECF subfamily)